MLQSMILLPPKVWEKLSTKIVYEVECKNCGWKKKPKRKGNVYFVPEKCPNCGSEDLSIKEIPSPFSWIKPLVF